MRAGMGSDHLDASGTEGKEQSGCSRLARGARAGLIPEQSRRHGAAGAVSEGEADRGRAASRTSSADFTATALPKRLKRLGGQALQAIIASGSCRRRSGVDPRIHSVIDPCLASLWREYRSQSPRSGGARP